MSHQGPGVSVDLGGFRAGGFARGQQARQQLGLQEQQLGIQQQGLEQQQAAQLQKQGQDVIKRADERVKVALEEAKQLRDAVEAGLLSPEQEQAATESLNSLIEATQQEDALIEANFGRNPGNADKLRRFQTSVVIDRAKVKGVQAGQETLAQREAELGRPLTPEEREREFGPEEQERFEDVFDSEGNIVGQKSTLTGRVVTDPRAEGAAAQFEPVLNEAGDIVAQRNIATGEVKADPRAPKEVALKPAQRGAASFAVSMEESNVILDELGAQFSGALALGGALPTALQSSDRQRFEQAKRNFINAQLRDVSGAAISASEFESADKQYIPVAGDSEEVLQQKSRNRQIVTEGLKAEAGRAFAELKARLPSLTVTIRGRQFNVGEIVTNGRGQSGRIEQDGSITLLE